MKVKRFDNIRQVVARSTAAIKIRSITLTACCSSHDPLIFFGANPPIGIFQAHIWVCRVFCDRSSDRDRCMESSRKQQLVNCVVHSHEKCYADYVKLNNFKAKYATQQRSRFALMMVRRSNMPIQPPHYR